MSFQLRPCVHTVAFVPADDMFVCFSLPTIPSSHHPTILITKLIIKINLISAWALFTLMQLLMFLSRTFIAAHFPHQVILVDADIDIDTIKIKMHIGENN